MSPIKHNDERPNRPGWWNGISLGNVMTIIGVIFVAGSVYATVVKQQEAQSKELQAVEQRGKERTDMLRADLQRLEAKIDMLLTRKEP